MASKSLTALSDSKKMLESLVKMKLLSSIMSSARSRLCSKKGKCFWKVCRKVNSFFWFDSWFWTSDCRNT